MSPTKTQVSAFRRKRPVNSPNSKFEDKSSFSEGELDDSQTNQFGTPDRRPAQSSPTKTQVSAPRRKCPVDSPNSKNGETPEKRLSMKPPAQSFKQVTFDDPSILEQLGVTYYYEDRSDPIDHDKVYIDFTYPEDGYIDAGYFENKSMLYSIDGKEVYGHSIGTVHGWIREASNRDAPSCLVVLLSPKKE
jgi:hypothetical protein